LRPECFEDLIPTVALYRPGPLGSGMVDDFIAGKHGKKIPQYLHPKLEPILKETFGVILYQEQVMQIVQTLAGFTLGQADILRRAMGKKKAEILLAQKENFLRGCEKNGVAKSLAEKIFELLTHFADYGFNKSHSAAYGLLAWQTAYLKAHYPAEYMAAILTGTMEAEKISAYIEMSRRMGVKVLSPDINRSTGHFIVDNGAILFGLSAIKSVGEAAVKNIVTERNRGGKFKSLADFCARLDAKKISRHTLEHLIKCGAFDSVDKRRTAMLAAIDKAMSAGYRRQQERGGVAISLFDEDELHATNMALPDVKESSITEILAWEKQTLGFYISGHPLEIFRDKLSLLTKSTDLPEKISGKRVKVGGIITNVRRVTTKKGDTMAFVTLEDFNGTIDITLFPNPFYMNAKLAQPDEVVVVEGRVENSGDGVQILADRFTAAENYAVDFWLTIPAQLETNATNEQLKKIFSAHKGWSHVFLNLGGKWKKLVQKISDSAELRNELKNLLGNENIRLY